MPVVTVLSGSDGKGVLISPTWVSYWFASERELSFDTAAEGRQSFQRQSRMALKVYNLNI